MARPRIHDDTVRLRLLEAASERVTAGGAAAVSLRSVAEQAETTTAAVYSLFGDREALIHAVIDEGFRRFAEYLAAVPQTDDPWEDLIALGLAYRRNAVTNPHFYRVMFTAGTPDLAHPTFERLVHAVARLGGQASEAPGVRALHVWSYVHGLIMLELANFITWEPGQQQKSFRAALEAAESLVR